MPTIMALMKYRKRGMQGWGIVFECVTVGGSGWADVKLQAHFSFSKGLFRWGSEDGMKNMQIQYTNSVQMQYKWTVVSTWMLCMCVIFVVTNVRANRNSMSTIRLNTWELFIVVTNAISRQRGKHMWENTWACTILTEGLQLMYNLLGRV